ncbi:piggyBac transposable element-derived protein 4-like [Leptopilina heterotoma]|uniref:piggyBac transposable element-derived protein 4-like n=1 Tax=Leptopilina heterotoma TaxID=63436 RepID=UPI001CA9A256|nr:piggyBac transposable element-derived protein 4-like [Leptopilina heterotoma]
MSANNDNNFEWFEKEVLFDHEDQNSDDDDFPDQLEENFDNTDTEQSDSENEEFNDNNNKETFFIGKDKTTKWSASPGNKNVRTRKHNIIKKLPGVKGEAKNAKSILECWQLFFTDSMIKKIVEYTNIRLDKIKRNYKRERDVRPTSVIEIRAVFGLLYLIGTKKSNHLNLEELWTTDGTAPDYFRAAMSLQRFYQLLNAIRFDNIHTREERIKSDKLAPIREIFEAFNNNCKKHFTPGQNVTLDEMLESFRGRCSFRQYMPIKPAKYGIKVWAIVDSRLFYTVNLEIYPGKQQNGPYNVSNAVNEIVKRVSEPILNTGRNITMDNYFSSIPLAIDLVTNCRTTIVSTLRKNKREIPPEFVAVKGRNICSSKFGFTEKCSLVSYVPKKNKNVLMLSTLYNSDDIDKDTGSRKKPEIITFYNLMKGAVDVVDELKGTYSVSRETRRWPMVLFYSFLNIAGINSQIILRDNSGEKMTRRSFLSRLRKELVQPFFKTRLEEAPLTHELRLLIKKLDMSKSIKKRLNKFKGCVIFVQEEKTEKPKNGANFALNLYAQSILDIFVMDAKLKRR